MTDNAIQANIEVDFPYLNQCYTRNNFVREIMLLHLFPYMFAPASEKTINQYKAPVFAKTSSMILKRQSDKKQLKFKLDTLNNVIAKDSTSDYFAYRLEYDELQKLGGDERILNDTNWSMLQNYIREETPYILSIYSVIKSFIKLNTNNPQHTYGYNDAFEEIKKEGSKFNEFHILGSKALEEHAWKNFKSSAHLIYGYIEALYANNRMPEIPERITNLKTSDAKKYITDFKSFLRTDIANVLLDTQTNAKLFNDIVGYALYAQSILDKNKHKNNSNRFHRVVLSEQKFRENYGIKAKNHYFEQVAIK